MIALPPNRQGQQRMMTITGNAPEVGHWFSPEAVREMLAQEPADIDILAAYSRTDGHREWVNVGTWLRKGEVIAQMDDPRKK